MDCQEWKDRDLCEGYKKFAKDLNKVNYAFASILGGMQNGLHDGWL